ncbi:MAG: 2-C-methyl-D-erythritol 4-phosphate cytidylyltransferase [Burkholderiales bacterium]
MNRIVVLVAAAGGGSRFGTAAPKQYAMLDGKPVILRTLARLASMNPYATFVALAPDDRDYERLHERPAPVRILRCGGDTRARTIANAVESLAAELDADDWIVVHDAARPCVPVDALARLVAGLEGDGVGGLLAVPVADTLKRGDAYADAPRVEATVPRAGLWQAQTPQMFRLGVLRRALAREGAMQATDESQAVEALGLAPRLVRGSPANLKITFAEDLPLAAAILAAQERA